MAEAAGGEFWREFKPVAQVFRPGAMPEAYIANAAIDDDRYYAPWLRRSAPGRCSSPPSQNWWCDVLLRLPRAGEPGTTIRQQVFAYTISGKWGIPGARDWVATAADDWIYEAPARRTRWWRTESDEPMRVTFNSSPARWIWLDENGEPNGHFDVFDYIKLCREHYEKVGIGADYIGQAKPRAGTPGLARVARTRFPGVLHSVPCSPPARS